MASFADKIPQFNPYVEQLPVEAMVKVGMEKQRRYDEGIQKIQSHIDQVAGLDVMRDVDKRYLQSKLGELESKLKTVAAGDFSNYQLVNSVSGMTNQIAKDTNIQNAIYSTQMVRKGQSEMETARKSGKSSVQNEAWWNNQVNDWLSNEDIKSRFSGRFVEFTDVDKKLRDMVKEMEVSETSIDNPFIRDASGKTLYFKVDPKTGKESVSLDASEGGTPRVDDAILSTTIKGKSADKIYSNFLNSLNENDINQLRIDSWYHYRGVTSDAIKQDVVNNYNVAKKMADDKLVELNLKLTTDKNLTPVQKDKIQAVINDTSESLKNQTLEKERDRQLAEINSAGDIENYKYKIYTQKYLQNRAQDLSSQTYKVEYQSNPYAQLNMERERLKFSYWNARREQENSDRSFNFEKLKWLEKKTKEQEDRFTAAFPGAVPTDIKVPTIGDVNTKIDVVNEEINALDAKFAPKITDKSLDTPEKKKAYLDGLMVKWRENPSATMNSQDNNMRQYIQRRAELDDELNIKIALHKATLDVGQAYRDQMISILKPEPSLTTSDGTTLSAADVWQMVREYRTMGSATTPYTVSPSGTGVIYSDTLTDENKRDFLSRYKGTNKERLAKALVENFAGKPLSEESRRIVKYGLDLENKYGKTLEKINEQRLNAETDYLAKNDPSMQTTDTFINMDNKRNEAAINNLVSHKLKQYEEADGKRLFDKDFSGKTLSQLLIEKGTKIVLSKNNEDGSGNVWLMNQAKGLKQRLPVTAGELSTTFPELAMSHPLDRIKTIADFSKNGTTNILGDVSHTGASAVGAYIKGYSNYTPQIANSKYADLVRFDVEKSPMNTGGSGDLFQVYMYVNNGDTWIPRLLNRKGHVTITGVQDILKDVNPSDVEQVLNQK